MLRVRDIAFRLLPVLVVFWATVAVLGGAIYVAKHTDPSTGGTAAQAGLGLCAVSVALFAGRAVLRAASLRTLAGLRSRLAPPRPRGRLGHRPLSVPPETGPPIFVRLRVLRT